ncbi:unnamed protein product [Closterium sp. NIES-54]
MYRLDTRQASIAGISRRTLTVGVALGVELEEEGLEVRPLVWPCLVVQRGVEVALGVASSNSRAARRSSRCNSFVSGRSAGGTRVGGASPQESLLPHQLRAWANRWDGPGGGAGGADSGSAVPTGTRGSGSVTTQPQQSALCHLLSLSPGATEFSVVDTTPPLLFPPTGCALRLRRAATGAEPAGAGSGGAGSGGVETGGAEPGGAETGGAESGGAETGGAKTWGAEPGGAATGGTEPGGAEPGVTEPGGAEPRGAGSTRVASRGASSRREVLSPQELREWFARHWSRAAGAGGTTATTGSGGSCPGGAGAAGPGGTAEDAGVGPPGGSAGASGGTGAAGSAGPAAAGATGVGATGGVGAGGSADAGPSEGAGAGAAGAGGATGAGAPAGSPGSGGAPRPRPYFVPLLDQVLGLPPSPSPAPPSECPQPVQSQSLLQPVSPLPAPSPYTGPTGGLAERRAPASRPVSPARPACTSRRTSRPRPPAVPGTHQMTLRPSTAPLRVPLPSPPASSLPASPDPESDSLRAASPTVARFLATVVTDPSLASTAASALVAELVDFAASCRLDYAASLVADSASVCPPSVGGECALSTDVLEDRQEEFLCFAAALPHLVSTLLAPEGDPDAPDISTPRSYAEAIEGPYSSQWQAAMDAEMASWKSTGTYVDEVPPPGANIVSGMWIFRVKRPPGSPPLFKARYVARGFSFPTYLGTADNGGIVTFTSWTHPPDLDPDFSPEGFWYSHTIPEAERTRALAKIQHSAAEETTSAAAEPTSAATETTAATAVTSTPIAGPSTASAQIDDTPPTPAQQFNPTSREVHRSANFTAGFYSNSDLYRRSPGHRAGEDIWHA